MTRPPAETKEPEPPLLKRTDSFMRCASHGVVTSKLYFAWSWALGGLEKSHMPSSARAPPDSRTENVTRVAARVGRNFIGGEECQSRTTNSSRKRRTAARLQPRQP